MWLNASKLYKDNLSKENKLLLVIAHPDDEAMFFGPTLLSLSKSFNVSILCLSNGNYNGLGLIRSKELVNSCIINNISNDNITIIDHIDLQDGMNNNWSIDIIADIIINNIKNIDTIITFDNYGISGHPNHIATYKGVVLAHQRLKDISNVKVLLLTSVNIIRKFLGLFDIILSLILSKNIAITLNVLHIWKAMAAHSSQFVWYRKLFVIFSRYSYVNTFTILDDEE